MTAAKIMKVIARLPGYDREAASHLAGRDNHNHWGIIRAKTGYRGSKRHIRHASHSTFMRKRRNVGRWSCKTVKKSACGFALSVLSECRMCVACHGMGLWRKHTQCGDQHVEKRPQRWQFLQTKMKTEDARKHAIWKNQGRLLPRRKSPSAGKQSTRWHMQWKLEFQERDNWSVLTYVDRVRWESCRCSSNYPETSANVENSEEKLIPMVHVQNTLSKNRSDFNGHTIIELLDKVQDNW